MSEPIIENGCRLVGGGWGQGNLYTCNTCGKTTPKPHEHKCQEETREMDKGMSEPKPTYEVEGEEPFKLEVREKSRKWGCMFHDLLGEECILAECRASSANELLLGRTDPHALMNLNRPQVRAIRNALTRWLETGSLEETE